MDLSNRTAVVTGATSGIGTATARALHAAGASVAVVGRREERLNALAAELGERAVAIAADVSGPASPTASTPRSAPSTSSSPTPA